MARGWEGEEVHGTEGKSTENALMFKEEGWGGGGGVGGERNEGHPKVTWHWAFKTSCLSFQSKLAQTVDQISRGYSNINIYSDKQPPKKPSVSKLKQTTNLK